MPRDGAGAAPAAEEAAAASAVTTTAASSPPQKKVQPPPMFWVSWDTPDTALSGADGGGGATQDACDAAAATASGVAPLHSTGHHGDERNVASADAATESTETEGAPPAPLGRVRTRPYATHVCARIVSRSLSRGTFSTCC